MKDELFDGFTLNLFFDDEHWLAHFAEMPEISAFASSPEMAVRELPQPHHSNLPQPQ